MEKVKGNPVKFINLLVLKQTIHEMYPMLSILSRALLSFHEDLPHHCTCRQEVGQVRSCLQAVWR